LEIVKSMDVSLSNPNRLLDNAEWTEYLAAVSRVSMVHGLCSHFQIDREQWSDEKKGKHQRDKNKEQLQLTPKALFARQPLCP